MYFLPTDTAIRLRAAGLQVIEISGWQSRGRPASTGSFNPVGVLNHHTGARDVVGDFSDDLSYAKWLFTGEPRNGLPKPLCQIGLSVEGVVYLGAAGRANHAGDARPSGSVAGGDGNSIYVGIEWMLSGTQPIPPSMYKAGVLLNAALLEILGSSAQAVSCHYQTSYTGKWDIGDPSGVPFHGRRVLDVPKFRLHVTDAKRSLNPPKREKTRIKIVQASMQFSDTADQMRADVRDLFGLEPHFMAGTEAGGRKAKPLIGILRAHAERNGYRFFKGVGSDCWLSVREDVAQRRWKTGVVPVLPAVPRKNPARGITWGSWEHDDMGKMTMSTQHYNIKGSRPGDPNYHENLLIARAIGDFGRSRGRGKAVVFNSGDQNMRDRIFDTYLAQPFTSGWDEKRHYEPTYPTGATLDVISSFDRDGRVRCHSIKSLSDREFPQFSDHFPVVALYDVHHV